MDECAVIASGALILTAGQSGEKARKVFQFSSDFYRAKKSIIEIEQSLLHDLAGSLQQEKFVEKIT